MPTAFQLVVDLAEDDGPVTRSKGGDYYRLARVLPKLAKDTGSRIGARVEMEDPNTWSLKRCGKCIGLVYIQTCGRR